MDWKGGPVSSPQLLQSLKLTAIDQNPLAISLEKVLRAGNSPRGPEKRQRRHRNTLLESALTPLAPVSGGRLQYN